jgi:hypothetical protein
MDKNPLPDFRRYFEEWAQDLEMLRQNRLMGESAFITFARDRGIAVSGVITGDPGNLHKRGWLASDSLNHHGGLLFHPFRIYPLHCILEKCELLIAASVFLERDSLLEFIEQLPAFLLSIDLGEDARESNQVADLAVLLEPIYWPRMTGRRFYPIDRRKNKSDFTLRQDQYRRKASQLVGTLDPNLWRNRHESLRFKAAGLDDNDKLYLLLRLANWKQRESLKGRIALALWMRHIAEVIRRAFEEVHAERWPEEDHAVGWWPSGLRTRLFGSERPLDDALQSKPYLAWEFGLFTGSSVRWYVEGETEYYAILHALPEPSKVGIELINLRGVIGSGRDNIALKLGDWLKGDKAFRRFSLISFDCDVETNVKTVRRQLERQNIVGLIAAHKPDFEFDNFTLQELAEVAARIDEANSVSGDAVRTGDWTGIASARAFEQRYKEISARRPRALKGKEWGEALAVYAAEHPNRPDDGSERPFVGEIRAALKGRIARYDFQKKRFGFDRDTFEQIDLPAPDARQGDAETGTAP